MKFILTRELGKLTRWLRILGYDSIYYREDNISSLVIESLRDNRIIVTRTKKLDDLKTKIVVIESSQIEEQLKEIKHKLNLVIDESKMFTRCTVCNEPLFSIKKKDFKKDIPEYVYKTQEVFMQCKRCERIYWQGSHWGNVRKIIKALK
ncbi:MAG: hypothetical protein JSV34_01155 [Candidatus Omnitrophota bacterium]|nr:MAG: hypothetical protein JSV34_01155 [Candidatus Omnitrophota bacterium]